ncbi:hypothetical protein DRO29_05710, partial [Candidatus Bathyarchaeota archaeon]
MRVIDVSDPFSPYEVGYYERHATAYDVFVQDNYIY